MKPQDTLSKVGRPFLGLAMALLLFLPSAGLAVLISGGDGTGNTNAPPDDPGWNQVGYIIEGSKHAASVVHLLDRWFITAHHNTTVTGGVVFGGITYAVDPNSLIRLTNSGALSGSSADLILFQTTTRPPLPAVTLRSSQIPNNALVTMIGDGLNRETDLTYWTSDWVKTDESSGVYSGYVASGSSGTLRWGTNRVSSRDAFATLTSTNYGFQVIFDGGVMGEGHGMRFDSGGGVFYKNGSTWELAGIMVAQAGYNGQPNPALNAVFGNKTYMVDLSYYRDQILSIMPEPSTLLMLSVVGLAYLWRRQQRARCGRAS